MKKIWRNMTLVLPHFTACAHSSSVYTNLNKLPLRQSLYLGLHLSAGTKIACGRVCKGDDLDDGLLMPKLSLIGDDARAGKEIIFSTAVRPKIGKKV